MSPSLWPASSCSMSSFTLAAITSFAVWAFGVAGHGLDGVVAFVVGRIAGLIGSHGVISPL